MEYVTYSDGLKASRLALGCMRIAGKSVEEVDALVRTALDEGINFFDHADIYGGGDCEYVFGEALRHSPGLREKMIIQTKCDIVPGNRYDTSREHILACVDRSLDRLGCGYLDVLLLHRPDPLMDPREVSETFEELYSAGKVRRFGVSNFSAGKMALLQKHLKQPLVADQMQLSLAHSLLLDADVFVDMADDHAVSRDGGVVDYCMLHDVTLQIWCPLQASWEEGTFLNHPKYGPLNEALERLAGEYGVTKAAVALAWILRHPAGMQAVVGTTSPAHLREACAASGIKLTRQQWYDLYLAAGKTLP